MLTLGNGWDSAVLQVSALPLLVPAPPAVSGSATGRAPADMVAVRNAIRSQVRQSSNRISAPSGKTVTNWRPVIPVEGLVQTVETDGRMAFHAVEARAQLPKGAIDWLDRPLHTGEALPMVPGSNFGQSCAFPE